MLSIILDMNGGSLSNELMDHFHFDPEGATSSAFIQQRAKILPEVFRDLLLNFNDEMETLQSSETFHEMRLFAADGSDIQIPVNPEDEDSFYPGANGQHPYNMIHLNALYDLLSNTYVDAIIQKNHNMNERQALIDMVENSPFGSALVIADRGYESYNCMAHIQEAGWYYLIRIKDKRGIARGLELPASEEFDLNVSLNLTRRMTNEVKELIKDKNRYRYIPNNVNFDYLPPLDGHHHVDTVFYNIPFRIVRIRISDDTLETLVTNLPASSFTSEDLKHLYALRWGIETSFRSLKYFVGMLQFHAKNTRFVIQEVYASLVVFNFVAWIILQIPILKKSCEYSYKINFAAATHICKRFLREKIHPPDMEKLITKYVSPIRPNRTHPRDHAIRSAINFTYRIA